MSIVKKISLDVSLYMRLIHQENKFPIHVIRMRYHPPPPKKKKKKKTKKIKKKKKTPPPPPPKKKKKKICPSRRFSNSFCHWNLNNKETFLFCFKPKIWLTKRCKFALVSHYLNNRNIKNSFWNDKKVT